ELDLEKHESVERPEKPVELPRPQPVAHLLDDTVLGGLEKRLGHIVRNHRLDFASSYAGAALTGQHRPPPLAGTDPDRQRAGYDVGLAKAAAGLDIRPESLGHPRQVPALDFPCHQLRSVGGWGFRPSTAIRRLRRGTRGCRNRSSVRRTGTWDSA